MIFGLKAKGLGGALCALMLTTAMTSCDFVDSTVSNPNSVPNASVDQLFTAVQVNGYYFSESQLARISSMWLQQMAGTDRQFTGLDQYDIKEDDADGEFSALYTGGGLIDIRRAKALAEEAGRDVYLGILQLHEAYLIGMGASLWGDIPYTEAGDPSITAPSLDAQEDIYASIQTLLDDAITNLQSGTGAGPGAADLNFGGDAARWTAVAWSLKARFYMHWVEAQRAGMNEAQTACGGDCMQKALDAAQKGIASPAGNWLARHSSASTENNLWFQFLRDRSGYISAGAYLVNQLRNDDDPRLSIYYSPGTDTNAGQYIGSPPGTPGNDPGTTASSLSATGFGNPAFNQPIVTCAETRFIIAEAQYALGNATAARNAADAGLACQETRYSITLPDIGASLSGQALLDEILRQKYIAMFLNLEAWNDWKRTCKPALISNTQVQVSNMPGRLFYGQGERQTNPNLPIPNQQPNRNTNDPAGC
jgi:hypothetical protein